MEYGLDPQVGDALHLYRNGSEIPGFNDSQWLGPRHWTVTGVGSPGTWQFRFDSTTSGDPFMTQLLELVPDTGLLDIPYAQ